MTRKLSSLIRRDIDSDDILVEDSKKILTSHEDINKKVTHRQEKHKRIATMVASTSQRRSLKEITKIAERGPHVKRMLA